MVLKRIVTSVINVLETFGMTVITGIEIYIDQSLCIETMKQSSIVMATTAILFLGLFTVTTSAANVQAGSQGFFGKLGDDIDATGAAYQQGIADGKYAGVNAGGR